MWRTAFSRGTFESPVQLLPKFSDAIFWPVKREFTKHLLLMFGDLIDTLPSLLKNFTPQAKRCLKMNNFQIQSVQNRWSTEEVFGSASWGMFVKDNKTCWGCRQPKITWRSWIIQNIYCTKTVIRSVSASLIGIGLGSYWRLYCNSDGLRSRVTAISQRFTAIWDRRGRRVSRKYAV